MTTNLKKSAMTILILGLALCIPAEMTLARQTKKGIAPIKPIDLKIRKMNAVKVGSTGGNDRVAVTVQVMAGANIPPGHEVCSGPFKVKVSKDMGGRWADIGIGGVANLCIGNRVAAATKTLTFTDLVPVDLRGARKYRAEVDFDNRVSEANERNNIGGTRSIHYFAGTDMKYDGAFWHPWEETSQSI